MNSVALCLLHLVEGRTLDMDIFVVNEFGVEGETIMWAVAHVLVQYSAFG